MLSIRVALVVFACAAVLSRPAPTAAQTSDAAGLAGVVRDVSGGVLPGVTVEVASPVLIEKVRTTVTDGQGLYRMVDLRPGVYSVTFSLTGFSTVTREGLELSSGFTATVNADLPVGDIAETVTVTGGSPGRRPAELPADDHCAACDARRAAHDRAHQPSRGNHPGRDPRERGYAQRGRPR